MKSFLFFCYSTCIIFSVKAQNNVDCIGLAKTLLPNGAYNYKDSDYDEKFAKNIFYWYKEHRDETYESIRKTSLSALIPVGELLVSIGLQDNEESYNRFIRDIETYYNNSIQYSLRIKGRWQTINVEALRIFENCISSARGLTMIPLLELDPSSRVLQFRYNDDYRNAPRVANIQISSKRNIRIDTKQVQNAAITDNHIFEILISKIDKSQEGVIVFNTNARVGVGTLSIRIPGERNLPPPPLPAPQPRTIPSEEISYLIPHSSGDRDFDGEVSFNCEVTLENSGNKEIFLNLKVTAQEINGDTRAYGIKRVSLFKSDQKITAIKSALSEVANIELKDNPKGWYEFTPYSIYANQDLDHLPGGFLGNIMRPIYDQLRNKYPSQLSNRGLIKTWKFLPDQDGDDSGIITSVLIITHPINITIEP